MDQLTSLWDQLAGRVDGPFFFRFFLQPIMAGHTAVRAGLADARNQRAPYLWTVLSNPVERPQLIRDGFKDITRVFVFAVVMDVAYQLIVFRWIHPLQVLIVAVVLAIVPYALVRGPVTRIAARRL
jgi:hypothetical protein